MHVTDIFDRLFSNTARNPGDTAALASMKTRVNEGPALERSSDDARSSSSSSRYAARCRALVRYEAAEAAFERIPKSFNNCIFSHRCYETGGDIIVDRQMDKVQETDKIKGAGSNEQQKTTDIEDGRLRV